MLPSEFIRKRRWPPSRSDQKAILPASSSGVLGVAVGSGVGVSSDSGITRGRGVAVQALARGSGGAMLLAVGESRLQLTKRVSDQLFIIVRKERSQEN